MRKISECRLYGIVDLGYVKQDQVVEMTTKLCEGGVDIVQLRAKKLEPSMIEALGREMLAVTRQFQIPMIINDHVEVAMRLDTEGVHVGQDDLPISEVRKLVGPNKIIGKSTHSLEQSEKAMAEAIDYIGFGPLYATGTKPDYVPIGLQDIATMQAFASKPAFCIGGVNAARLDEILEAGAKRVVVVSAFLQAADVVGEVSGFKSRLVSGA